MKCRHRNVNPYVYQWRAHAGYGWYLARVLEEPMAKRCLNCGATLPLGPSNDSDPRVQLEMRAAELATDADHMKRLIHNGIPGEDDEVDGYLTSFNGKRAPSNEAQWAGYLARCISTHNKEAP